VAGKGRGVPELDERRTTTMTDGKLDFETLMRKLIARRP
jgi:hypothetical protein